MIARVRAVTFIRPLKGRTRPCLMLCEDEDGNQQEAVVKLRAGFETKETGLVCELLASLLAGDLDLPVPKLMIVAVEAGLDRAIPVPEVAGLVRKSVGLSFGSARLPSGINTWPKDKPVPMQLRPLAAEIFAFDAIVQNPDRRRDNPNLLWKGDDLYIYDHELAFSFVAGVIGWQPPWTGQGLEFLRNHVFYDGLKGTEINLDRLTGALEAVSDRRLKEYTASVPAEWTAKTDATRQIVKYVKEARRNGDKIVSAITRILQ